MPPQKVYYCKLQEVRKYRNLIFCLVEAVQNHKAIKPSQRDQPSPCSSPEICATQTSLPSLLSTLDSSPARYGAPMETKGVETSEAYHSNRASYKSRSLEVVMQSDLEASSMELLEKEQEGFGESLQDILKWARPLPPVLSPIPPAASSVSSKMGGADKLSNRGL